MSHWGENFGCTPRALCTIRPQGSSFLCSSCMDRKIKTNKLTSSFCGIQPSPKKSTKKRLDIPMFSWGHPYYSLIFFFQQSYLNYSKENGELKNLSPTLQYMQLDGVSKVAIQERLNTQERGQGRPWMVASVVEVRWFPLCILIYFKV